MAIFSRRTIQRLIDENASFLTRKQLKSHVRRLNSNIPTEYLSAEWEVVILNAFNKLGTVHHEPDLGGRCTPDIMFTSIDESGDAFIADITAVSDDGISKQNPVDALFHELFSLVEKYGLKMTYFSVEVGSYDGTPYVLKLPGRSRFNEVIFTNSFHSFLSNIVASPEAPRKFVLDTADAKITISYCPGQGNPWLSHPTYTEQYTATRNPIFARLEDKYLQLRDSGFAGPCGIVVCDAASVLLSPTPSRTAGDTIRSYLLGHPDIAFVIVVGVGFNGRSFECRVTLYEGVAYKTMAVELQGRLNMVANTLPVPIASPVNARNHLSGSNRKIGLGFYGGFSMGGREIKISSQALIGLLSGKISPEKFFDDHDDVQRFFARLTAEGRTVKEILVSNEPDKDDDWIVFRFGDPDAAISPFRSR